MRVEDFEEIALPHLRDLLRTATRILGNRTEAEDVVQDTFLQAWKSIHRFTPGTNIRAWLFTILFRASTRHRRKWQKFDCGWTEEYEAYWEENLVYAPPISPSLTDEDLLMTLDKLPSGYKVVLLLAVVEDFPYKEIAEILQIPIGTVMSRLHRARKLLAHELRDKTQSPNSWPSTATLN